MGEVDFIVVGGGSAGCAVAGRLAEAGLVVTLLEAGGPKPHLNTTVPALVSKLVTNPEFDWTYFTEPDASRGGRPDLWPAGKRLGGGSAINGMMFIRGHADDYDRWRDLGASGWGYDDCLPHFIRMETSDRPGPFHGHEGPVKVSESALDYSVSNEWIESAVAAGIPRCEDLNGDGRKAMGVDRVQQSQWRGRRWSTADAYLRSPRANSNLVVQGNARVHRIIVERGAACGVSFELDGELHELRARRGVVLSAGTIASPKLLMLSGIGPADHLSSHGVAVQSDVPGVGQNLQEHPGIHLVHEVDADTINSDMKGIGPLKAVAKYLLGRRGPLTAGIGTAQAIVRLDGDLDSAVQLAFSPFGFEISPSGERRLASRSTITTMVGALHPHSRGSLELRSADPAAPPIIRHKLLADERDVTLLARGLDAGRSIFEQGPLAGRITGEARPSNDLRGRELSDWIRGNAFPLFHPVGTCRMGTDDLAVVDPSLRVRGVPNLWVADCSVAPTLVGANTNATAIMIGEKASDLVLEQLGRPRAA